VGGVFDGQWRGGDALDVKGRELREVEWDGGDDAYGTW